jgi:hypothetical protein
MELDAAARTLKLFQTKAIRDRISAVESYLKSKDRIDAEKLSRQNGFDINLLFSAAKIKGIAGQINVIIHAAGILLRDSNIKRARLF